MRSNIEPLARDLTMRAVRVIAPRKTEAKKAALVDKHWPVVAALLEEGWVNDLGSDLRPMSDVEADALVARAMGWG